MKVTIELEELRKLVDLQLRARMIVAESDQALYDFYRKIAVRKEKPK